MKQTFMNFKSKLKEVFNSSGDADTQGAEEEYVELDTSGGEDGKQKKILIRPYTITDFADVKPVLEALRDGNTVGLINIKPLKDKDLVELKRSINKLKKTCEAIEGDIAGFGDDWIVVVPSFGTIHRAAPKAEASEKPKQQDEFTDMDFE